MLEFYDRSRVIGSSWDVKIFFIVYNLKLGSFQIEIIALWLQQNQLFFTKFCLLITKLCLATTINITQHQFDGFSRTFYAVRLITLYTYTMRASLDNGPIKSKGPNSWFHSIYHTPQHSSWEFLMVPIVWNPPPTL